MELPTGWTKKDGALHFTTKCADFKQALILVNSIGEIAENIQHHPDLTIQNYNEVHIRTTTHDASGVSDKDYRLANSINQLIKL